MKKANFNKKKLNLSKKTILILNEKSLVFMHGGTRTTLIMKPTKGGEKTCESCGCGSFEEACASIEC